MNFDLIFALIFYGLLLLFYFKNKSKFARQGILLLYRTKVGIKLMDKFSKHKLLLNILSYFSILIGFLGMFLILYILIRGTYSLIFIPDSPPVLAPVLPGIKIPGLPTLSFWHWIISIFIIAVIHEFAHGIYARLYKIKIKSSGFAFLGPILAAFVEPDEKVMKKVSNKKQLAIISAGPFVNIVFAFLILLFIQFIFFPFIFNSDGITVVNIEKDSPASLANLQPGIIIREVNNLEVTDPTQVVELIQSSQGKEMEFLTDRGEFFIKPVMKDNKYYIGISVTHHVKPSLEWFYMLLYWLWVISFGIGLFNLLPLGPIDGGRIFYVAMLSFFNEKKSMKLFKSISIFCLILIIINLMPYLIKLFKWIIGLFS